MLKDCTNGGKPPLLKTFQRRVKESSASDKGAPTDDGGKGLSLEPFKEFTGASGFHKHVEKSQDRPVIESPSQIAADCPTGLLKSLRVRRTSVILPFTVLLEAPNNRKKGNNNRKEREHRLATKRVLEGLVAKYAEVDAFELVVEDDKPSPKPEHRSYLLRRESSRSKSHDCSYSGGGVTDGALQRMPSSMAGTAFTATAATAAATATRPAASVVTPGAEAELAPLGKQSDTAKAMAGAAEAASTVARDGSGTSNTRHVVSTTTALGSSAHGQPSSQRYVDCNLLGFTSSSPDLPPASESCTFRDPDMGQRISLDPDQAEVLDTLARSVRRMDISASSGGGGGGGGARYSSDPRCRLGFGNGDCNGEGEEGLLLVRRYSSNNNTMAIQQWQQESVAPDSHTPVLLEPREGSEVAERMMGAEDSSSKATAAVAAAGSGVGSARGTVQRLSYSYLGEGDATTAIATAVASAGQMVCDEQGSSRQSDVDMMSISEASLELRGGNGDGAQEEHEDDDRSTVMISPQPQSGTGCEAVGGMPWERASHHSRGSLPHPRHYADPRTAPFRTASVGGFSVHGSVTPAPVEKPQVVQLSAAPHHQQGKEKVIGVASVAAAKEEEHDGGDDDEKEAEEKEGSTKLEHLQQLLAEKQVTQQQQRKQHKGQSQDPRVKAKGPHIAEMRRPPFEQKQHNKHQQQEGEREQEQGQRHVVEVIVLSPHHHAQGDTRGSSEEEVEKEDSSNSVVTTVQSEEVLLKVAVPIQDEEDADHVQQQQQQQQQQQTPERLQHALIQREVQQEQEAIGPDHEDDGDEALQAELHPHSEPRNMPEQREACMFKPKSTRRCRDDNNRYSGGNLKNGPSCGLEGGSHGRASLPAVALEEPPTTSTVPGGSYPKTAGTAAAVEDNVEVGTAELTIEKDEEKYGQEEVVVDVGLVSEPSSGSRPTVEYSVPLASQKDESAPSTAEAADTSEPSPPQPSMMSQELTPLQHLLHVCGQKPDMEVHQLPTMDDVIDHLFGVIATSGNGGNGTGGGAKRRGQKATTAVAVKRPIIVKVGEGSYGEAWRLGGGGGTTTATSRGRGGATTATTAATSSMVMKVVPIEGTMVFNDGPQKTAAEVMSEAIVGGALSALGNSGLAPGTKAAGAADSGAGKGNHDAPVAPNWTSGFVRMHAVSVCRGPYSRDLVKAWERWDKQHGSENEPVSRLPPDQLYWVAVMEDSGTDLERYVLDSWDQLRSLLLQVAVSLAVAEAACSFEHRDLHWGNVLVRRVAEGPRLDRTPTGSIRLGARLQGCNLRIASCGIAATIIDFTNSRFVAPSGLLVFCDLSRDPAVFEGTQGDVQFDTYRWMRSLVNDDWSVSCPATNCLWLSYLAEVLCKRFGSVGSGGVRLSTAHKSQIQEFRKRAVGYGSCCDLIWDELFQGLLQNDTR